VKSERGYGAKQADAEKYANEEIQMMVDGVTSAFGENRDNGGQLAEEK
jgi:predicted NUDIX family NTP pyrophosphohydrolase